MLVDGQEFEPGVTLGRYQLHSVLGEGGMGKVYLAEDPKLKRKVALKVLSVATRGDEEARSRLLREAQAAAALDHPNICAIYEVHEESDPYYIAMQYIGGETLEARIARGRLSLGDSLRIASQVADALCEAHAGGVIHRDIKPSNIMFGSRRQVKVLDFGLAKTADATLTGRDGATTKQTLTTPGMILGTVPYMSPEQLRGEPVDARSDIFSFGVVLYEMLSGQSAFGRSTDAETIGAILHEQPTDLSSIDPAIPQTLRDVVGKCLAKDADGRYQTMEQVARDLNAARNNEPAALSVCAAPTRKTGIDRVSRHEVAPTNAETAHTTSSAEFIMAEIKRHKTGAALALVLAAVIFVGGGFALYKLLTRSKPDAPPRAPKFTALTTGGRAADQLIEGEATISPDGKYVTYVALDEHQQRALWVKQVSTNHQVLLVPPAPSFYLGTTFSPNGEFVYYVNSARVNVSPTLYRIPVIGGTPVKILDNVWTAVGISPDARRFAFVRVELGGQGAEQKLMLADTDGNSEPTALVAIKRPQGFPALTAPSWSPDGKLIAIALGTNTGLPNCTLVGVSVADGKMAPLTSESWPDMGRVVWLPDGRGLIFTAPPQRNSIGKQVWHLSYPEGRALRITNDLNSYGDISLGVTADASTIATLQTITTHNIWVLAPNEAESHAKQITIGGVVDGFYDLSWLPDGRIVYDSRTGEYSDLWVVNADGTNRKQLTNNTYGEYGAAASPDGRYIVFRSDRSSPFKLWRMDADGSNPKQLTSGDTVDGQPTFSPDSQWVVFRSGRADKITIWKVSIQGGAAQQLNDEKMSSPPAVSPDGRLITYSRYVNQPGQPVRSELVFIPFDGGPAVKTMALPDFFMPFSFGSGRWTPDGHALYFMGVRDTVSNVWELPLDGSPPRQVTNFTSDLIQNFAISRDGRRLAVSRGREISDIVLIKDFR
jgi:serine/threonine protein kinase/Tol biopolymer transport system component